MFSFKSVLGNGNYTGQMQYLIALVMCEAIKQVKGVSELYISFSFAELSLFPSLHLQPST